MLWKAWQLSWAHTLPIASWSWKAQDHGWGALIEQDQMIETDWEVVMANGESVLVDPVYHIPGELNIANVATRGKADINDVAYGSMWQTGPR